MGSTLHGIQLEPRAIKPAGLDAPSASPAQEGWSDGHPKKRLLSAKRFHQKFEDLQFSQSFHDFITQTSISTALFFCALACRDESLCTPPCKAGLDVRPSVDCPNHAADLQPAGNAGHATQVMAGDRSR